MMLQGNCDQCRKRRMLFSVGHGIELCMNCRRKEAQAAGTKYVNQHGQTSGARNAYPGKRQGPLDGGQKARLCILAREAFEQLHGRAPASAGELEAWRREQQEKACGVASLTMATQEHWPALEAHFLDLKGESGKAFKRLMQPEGQRHRVALAVLRRELRGAGLNAAYAATICRQQYQTTPEHATPDQVWRIIFTIRNRGLAKAAKAKRPTTSEFPF